MGESVEKPLHYWDVNVNGSRCLLEAMQRHGCYSLVFSSSATLYGYPEAVPITETAPIAPINPYGHTKAAVEQMLNDLHASAPDAWRIACLRYFNPVGTYPSGHMGKNQLGISSNNFAFLSQVATRSRAYCQVLAATGPPPMAAAFVITST